MKNGYIEQYQERNYAIKKGKLTKSYKIQHQNRDECRKATETSSSNCHVESRKEQEEVEEMFKALHEIDNDAA